ncbi:hypothetical protein PVK06_020415 [Gossypium arboreum]|uniref:Reverse transcriptase zinc-binding domain-containing protein n=1 Tax=Gossypium arboreum TaxID=29729 RepID=A0ABR0PMA5_GOSAR|nr:hypothetical protein PVK06_020415 [Gossypium arboreum]
MDVAEMYDHIFFECSFSRKVWHSVLFCSIHRVVGTWRQELDWTILKLKGRSLLFAILKLAWNAYLCVIWRQRNKRYLGASFLTDDATMVHIKELV